MKSLRFRSSKGKSGTLYNERKSPTSTRSRGFSSIQCSDQIHNRFGRGKIILGKTKFFVPANWKLNDEDLNFLIKVISKNVAISLHVIDHENSGEKDLCFPMLDILRIPLCLSKLREDKLNIELGSVDDSAYLEFIIKRQQKIIFLVEIKKIFTEFEKGGFWQLLSQLATILSRNPDMVEVAGAFSDLKTWVFVKMTRSEDNKLHYSVSKVFRCFSRIAPEEPVAWEIECKEVLEYMLFTFASDKECGVDAAVSLFKNRYPQYEENLIKKITSPWEEAKRNALKEVLEAKREVAKAELRVAEAECKVAEAECEAVEAEFRATEAKLYAETLLLENQRLKRQLAAQTIPEEVPAKKKERKYQKVKKN